MNRNRLWLLLFACQLPLWSGCTAVLWDKNNLARYRQPADPANLCLYYSHERKDILVQYDETRDQDRETRRRCYWIEPNAEAVNRRRKPQFVPSEATNALDCVPVTETHPATPPPGLDGLYAVYTPHQDHFTLYSGTNRMDIFTLPKYRSDSQATKKVLLTPLALAGDATIVGAIGGWMWLQNPVNPSDFESSDQHRRRSPRDAR